MTRRIAGEPALPEAVRDDDDSKFRRAHLHHVVDSPEHRRGSRALRTTPARSSRRSAPSGSPSPAERDRRRDERCHLLAGRPAGLFPRSERPWVDAEDRHPVGIPGMTCWTKARRSGSRYGSGESSTECTSENTTAVALMPSAARDRREREERPGDQRADRQTRVVQDPRSRRVNWNRCMAASTWCRAIGYAGSSFAYLAALLHADRDEGP